MRPTKEQQTLLLLSQLTEELKVLTLWQKHRPSHSELASTLPFHYDTLTFEQWLQFVFIERISLIIDKEQSLPSEVLLLPVAEESFKSVGKKANNLLTIIDQIDGVLSGRNT